MFYFAKAPSVLGTLTLASDGENLVGLWIEGQKYFLASLPEAPQRRDDLPVFAAVKSWLEDYFAHRRPSPSLLPLAPMGSVFRQSVWNLLLEIPYGSTVTYGSLARRLSEESGKTASPRAVGGAVGHNPISIIIPCHRVMGEGGRLTGYAGGVEKKILLLEHEGIGNFLR